jgi:hypothetical protein
MTTWGELASDEPELAAYSADRLNRAPAYLATVRATGAPRVHPITPIVATDGLYVFMEPKSPKAADLRERGWYALHSGVPDMNGSGGELMISGVGVAVIDPEVRADAAKAASYEPADRYILFELLVEEVRVTGYGSDPLPARRRWSAPR